MKEAGGVIEFFKSRLTGPFIADLPPELAQCELGCRVLQCNRERWQNCEKRIRRMNGELALLRAVRTGIPGQLD